MSTSAIDSTTESTVAAQQKKQKAQGSSSSSDLFATLVQGQVPTNIVFTRVDRQLDVPKAAKAEGGAQQPNAFRDDRATDEVDTVEKYETGIAEDGSATPQETARDTAPAAASNDGGDATADDNQPAQSTQANQKPADGGDADDGSDAAAAAANAQQKSSGPDVQRAAPEVAVNRGVETQGNRPVANANAEVNGNTQAQAAGTDPNLAQKSAAKGQGKVSVSEQAVAKPAGTLSSGTATTVQADTAAQQPAAAQARDPRPTATQLANAASDSEATVAAQSTAKQVKSAAAGNGADKNNGVGDSKSAANTNNQGQAGAQSAVAAAASAVAPPAAQAAQAANSAGQAAAPLSSDPISGAAPAQQVQTAAGARATAKAAAAAKPKVPPQVVTEQVAVNINRAAGQGLDRITIQMRPPELGRVDVKMEVAQDGRLTAVISVERQETYDLLRGDSRALTQALQDAGLQADQNSLSFNLKGQGSDLAGNKGANGGNGQGSGDEAGDADPTVDDGLLALGEQAQPDAAGRYDVRV